MSEKPNAHKVISATTIPVYVAEIATASACNARFNNDVITN
jgi:hypothetical protein